MDTLNWLKGLTVRFQTHHNWRDCLCVSKCHLSHALAINFRVQGTIWQPLVLPPFFFLLHQRWTKAILLQCIVCPLDYCLVLWISLPLSSKGVARHFHMACITEKLIKERHRVTPKQIWAHLKEMYDFDALVCTCFATFRQWSQIGPAPLNVVWDDSGVLYAHDWRGVWLCCYSLRCIVRSWLAWCMVVLLLPILNYLNKICVTFFFSGFVFFLQFFFFFGLCPIMQHALYLLHICPRVGK